MDSADDTPPSWLAPELSATDLLLYEGDVRVRRESSGEVQIVRGQICFQYRPQPSVQCCVSGTEASWLMPFVGDDDEKFTWEVDDPDAALVPPTAADGAIWEGVPTGARWSRALLANKGQPVEQSTRVTSVRWHVLNFPSIRRQRGRLTFEVGDWRCTLTELRAGTWEPDLFESQDYAVTHIIDIERCDGTTFAANDTSEVDDAVSMVLSFAAGRLIGLAIRCGFEGTQVVSIDYRVRVNARFSHLQSWFHASLSTAIPTLVDGYLQLDPGVRQVVNRAIRMAMVANDGPELDVRIPTGQSTLEMLAWLILVEVEGWQTAEASRKADASANIRLMCKWAGIPTAVQREHEALDGHRRAFNHEGMPEVVADVRNRLRA